MDAFTNEIDPAESNISAFPLNTESDDSLALDFVTRNPCLRYVATWSKWLRWDGKRWADDSTLSVFDAVRKMLRDAPEKQAKKLRSSHKVTAIERLSRCDRRVAAVNDQWDSDDWSLNTPTGIIDLRGGSISQHDPARYHRKITHAAPNGSCPLWLQFLADVTRDDAELISYLQRVIGYGLTGSIREHALFFLYGGGKNGKGTFLNTIKAVLGDYATVASMETFIESQGERHPTDLALLHGARIVIAQETEEGRRWAESRLKALTGGDPITARFMRQDFFTFSPKFKLLIAGNHKPRLRNVDEAIRRRLQLIPFDVTIPDDRIDTDLAEKLRDEWPGIMQWALNGCCAYLEKGLCPPARVLDATREYFSSQDLFSEWLEDCCQIGDSYWETPKRLFESWRRFCEEHNEPPGKQAGFKDRMETAGFNQGRSAHVSRFWRRIRLAEIPDSGDR